MKSGATPLAETPPRFRALDGLRGIAALLVVLLHVQWPNHITGFQFVKNGYLAVDLFFILSGLVISANYSTTLVDARTACRFMALRFFRVYPLHLVMLIAFIGVECLKVGAQHTVGMRPEHAPFTGGQSPLSIVSHLLLMQGLGLMPTPGWNGPSWSISCEYVVYGLFAGATVLGFVRSRAALIVGAIVTAAIYAVLAITRGTLDIVYDLGLLRCIAGFFWGVLIHRWAPVTLTHMSKRNHLCECLAAVGVIVTIAIVSGALIVTVIPLFILLLALLRSDSGPVARLLLAAPVQYLGQISYSVYMVHQLVIVCMLIVLKRLAPFAYDPGMGAELVAINPWLGDFLVSALVAAVILIASGTYSLIEMPARLFGRNALRKQPSTGRPGKAAGYAMPSPGFAPTLTRPE